MLKTSKLSITAEFKDQGIKQLENTLKRLQKDAKGVSDTLAKFNLGKSAERGFFAKSILVAEQGMTKFKGTTQDTAKVLSNVYGRAVDQETKKLEKMTKSIENLNIQIKQKHDYLNKMRQMPGMSNLQDSSIVSDENRLAIKEKKRLDQFEKVEALTNSKTSPNIQALAVAQAVTQGIVQLSNQMQSRKNTELRNMVGTMAPISQMMNDFYSGDFSGSSMLNRRKYDKDGRYTLESAGVGTVKDASGTIESNIGNVIGAGSDVIGIGIGAGGLSGNKPGIPVDGGVGMISQAGSGMLRRFDYAQKGGAEATEGGSVAEGYQLMKQVDPKNQLMHANLRSMAGIRIAGGRRLGNLQGMAAGIGLGASMDPSEGISQAIQIANQFGSTRTMQGGIFGGAASMANKGFDVNTMAGILGNMGNASDPIKAKKELENIFAAGLGRGMKDVQFFERIGQAVSDGVFGRSGANVGNEAFGQMMFRGMGANTTSQNIADRISGVKEIDQYLKSNPVMMARGFSTAADILGSNVSGVSMKALGQASLQDLMANSNEEMDALGISKKQRRSMFDAQFQGMVGELTRNANEPITRELMQTIGTTGDLKSALRSSPQLAAKLAASLHQNEMVGSFGQAREVLSFFTGDNANLNKNAKFGDRGDGSASAQIQTQGQIAMQLWSSENTKQIIDDITKAGQAFNQLKDIRPSMEAGKEAIKVLEDVYEALKKIADLNKNSPAKAIAGITPKRVKAGPFL